MIADAVDHGIETRRLIGVRQVGTDILVALAFTAWLAVWRAAKKRQVLTASHPLSVMLCGVSVCYTVAVPLVVWAAVAHDPKCNRCSQAQSLEFVKIVRDISPNLTD
jgi:hypothetical protein